MMLTTYNLEVLVLAILFSLIITPFAMRLARRFDLIDVPGSSRHKQHLQPTPLAGGQILFIGLVLLGLIFGWFSDTKYYSLLGAILVIVLFGSWDDLNGMGARGKLTGQILAISILVISGSYIRIFSNPVANILLTYFWMLGMTNAFNLIDSMDGLAVGVAEIALLFFFMAALRYDQSSLSDLCLGLFGLAIGLTVYNIFPAKIFLGDSGAQLLGFVLALIGMELNPLSYPQLSSWFLPILVLGFPIFDTTLVVVSRLRLNKKIYQAERDHTYHRLILMGMAPTRAVYAIHLGTILLGVISFLALETGPIAANAIFFFILVGGVGIIAFLEWKYRSMNGVDDGHRQHN